MISCSAIILSGAINVLFSLQCRHCMSVLTNCTAASTFTLRLSITFHTSITFQLKHSDDPVNESIGDYCCWWWWSSASFHLACCLYQSWNCRMHSCSQALPNARSWKHIAIVATCSVFSNTDILHFVCDDNARCNQTITGNNKHPLHGHGQLVYCMDAELDQWLTLSLGN